jgi:hypothetical protein
MIWLKQQEIFENNIPKKKIEEELALKSIDFEVVYNLLKKFGNYEYCITAYDYDKLKQQYVVSTNLLGRFIFMSTKNLNNKSMKELYDKELNAELKEKIGTMLESYQKILGEYSDDTKEFYKKLKAFEAHFKLVENEK